jgi:tetratricopeptide (TPR) repeat protein
MKKRRKIKPHKDNIFLFPNVDKLLMEKGLDKINQKKFTDAIELLERALELDQENEEIALGLIIAYFEVNNLLAAKALAQDCLHKGFGNYFQLIDVYIMILLQLNEYEEIVTTIQALIDEREVPLEKLDNFTKILEFSKRKLEIENSKSNYTTNDELIEFNILQYDNLNDQFLAIAKLAHANVRAYLGGIKEYLQLEDGHPFLKTMLLQLLKEQEVNEELTLAKFNQTLSINPIHLEALQTYLECPEMMNVFKQSIEQENPTLYESIKAITSRHAFLLFPMDRLPQNPYIWAAAYHLIALEYHGEIHSVDKLANKYNVEQEAIGKAILFIRELEEISSPII